MAERLLDDKAFCLMDFFGDDYLHWCIDESIMSRYLNYHVLIVHFEIILEKINLSHTGSDLPRCVCRNRFL